VTSVSALLGRVVDFEEAAKALGEGCSEAWAALGVEIERGSLSRAELAAAKRLAAEKYSTEAWNLKR
jgi:lipoate-protein ligase A